MGKMLCDRCVCMCVCVCVCDVCGSQVLIGGCHLTEGTEFWAQ